MGFAFIDQDCPNCDGRGCSVCDYTGLVGWYGEVKDLPEPKPTVLGRQLLTTRLLRETAIREVAEMLGCKPSHISGIERGREEATLVEAGILKKWFKGEIQP